MTTTRTDLPTLEIAKGNVAGHELNRLAQVLLVSLPGSGSLKLKIPLMETKQWL